MGAVIQEAGISNQESAVSNQMMCGAQGQWIVISDF
jgi:hypothetical protein